MYVIRRGFLVRGGDKVFVDLYCSRGLFRICIIGFAKKPRGGRRISGVYDKLLTEVFASRGDYRECFEGEIRGSPRVRRVAADDKTYILVSLRGDLHVYFPLDKDEYVKKCIRIMGGG